MATIFRMKVQDLFHLGEKTVFAGLLETHSNVISNVPCVIQIDGKPAGKICISGEVRTGTPHRDFWTTSHVDLSRDIVRNHDVWLIAT